MRWPSVLLLFACLGLSWPVVVVPGPVPVGWDDAHYLHRAACITHAVFEPTLTGFGDCLGLVVKAPLMAWLGWPWGAQAATAAGIGLPFVSLTVLSFGVILALAWLMLRLAIPGLVILLAFLSLPLDRLLGVVAGGYEGDTLVSLLVALLGLLVPFELLRPSRGLWPSLGRGLAWGVVIALGVMAKTSFGYFAAALGPALLVLRLTRSGPAAAGLAGAAGLAVLAPVVAYHLLYWDNIIGHVRDSAVGVLAKYTSYGLGPWGYLETLFGRWGWPAAALSAALAAAAAGLIRRDRTAGWGWLAWPVLVLLGYLGLTALSENHDLRYGLPFLVALPFALAGLAAAETATRPAPGLPALLGAALAAVLLAVPMTQRPDLRHVQEVRAVLDQLPGTGPLTLLVASDDSAINLDTFLLAQQLDLRRFGRLRIDTVVYDEAFGHSEASILDRLAHADAVAFLKAPIRKSPEWTNRHSAAWRDQLPTLGFVRQDVASPVLDLFTRPPVTGNPG